MRIVTLTCSNTEIVCALGCQDMLVGVDDHSDYPPEVVAVLPRVGPDLEIDVARVAELQPDLVLASLTVPGHEKVVADLADAGLPFIAPAPTSLADVHRDVRDIGRHLGVPERAEEVVSRMERSMHGEGVESSRSGEPGERPRILVQWWPKPLIAPGRKSWVTDLLEAAGAVNPLGEEDVESRPVPDEEVANLAPDAMVISWCGVEPSKYRPDVVYRNPAFHGLPFLENQRVFCVPEAHLGRPSPRLVDGLQDLRRIVEAVRAPVTKATAVKP